MKTQKRKNDIDISLLEPIITIYQAKNERVYKQRVKDGFFPFVSIDFAKYIIKELEELL